MAATNLVEKIKMAKFSESRPSTVIRHRQVQEAYKAICEELGKFSTLVPKSYIYQRIKEQTGLCAKTIAHIINHMGCTPK